MLHDRPVRSGPAGRTHHAHVWWSVGMTLGLFTLGAVMLGIGIGRAFEARSRWETLSLLLLGLALLSMALGTRREALGRPVG